MTEQADLFTTTLQSHGYKKTKAREVVFLALANEEPMPMNTLVNKVLPAVDRASVYRTVKIFESLGIVQKLYIGWKYKIELSGKFSHHHHHITCIRCGRIVAFHESKQLDTTLNLIASKAGFRPVGHQIELTGICKQCHKNPGPRPKGQGLREASHFQQ